MKYIKHCTVFLLVMALACSMTLTAFADETVGSITISGTKEGKIYEIYKIFDLTMASSTAVAYTIDTDWVAFFAGDGASYITDTAAEGLNPITVDGKAKYINITEDNVAEFAQAALVYAASLPAADAAKTAVSDSVAFTDLALGYYLVYPQGATDIKEEFGSICSLTSTVPSVNVVVKAEYPTIEKTDDAVSADVGQIVTYKITGKVPDTTGFDTYTYTVSDVMSDGLTFRQDVVVYFGDTLVGVTPDYESTANGFSVTFDMAKWQDHKGEDIVITYTATVNENAVEPGTVEKNSATLTYSHDPKDETKTTTTPPEEENVYSSQIVIDKVDGEDNSVKLEGAQFVLMNEAKNAYYKLAEGAVSWVAAEEDATVVTTDENGTASFDGLKNGTYFLKEIQSPDGYNLLTEMVQVTVNGADNKNTSVSVVSIVENNSGTTLPSTGGAGTTAIYLGGSILMLASMILLIAKKRIQS